MEYCFFVKLEKEMDPFKVLRFCPKCGKSDWNETKENMRICNVCGYEMYKNPTIGAAALIVDDNNRLLVVRRAKAPAKGTLHIPGGFCEIGEKIEDALIREVREETNLTINIKKYLFSIPNHYEYKGIELFPLDFFFEARLENAADMKLDTEENSEILFIPLEEINIDDFGLESIRTALKMFLNK